MKKKKLTLKKLKSRLLYSVCARPRHTVPSASSSCVEEMNQKGASEQWYFLLVLLLISKRKLQKKKERERERERERESTGQAVQKVTRGMSWHAPSFPSSAGEIRPRPLAGQTANVCQWSGFGKLCLLSQHSFFLFVSLYLKAQRNSPHKIFHI